MGFFSFDGPLMRFLDKLGSLMLINFCFILFSIPIITIGASATAMYRCLLTMATDGDSGVLKLFWKSFKSNFKQSTLLELCILPVLALTIAESLAFFFGFVEQRFINCVGFVLPFILLMCVVSYIFPLQAQFENKIFITIKNAAFLAIMHLPATVIITAMNLIFPTTVCFMPELFSQFFIIWLLCGFSLVAYVNTGLLRRVFVQYFPPTKDAPPDDELDE